MIQRVQTIYLFIAIVLCVLAIALPIPYALSGSTALDMHITQQEVQGLQELQLITSIEELSELQVENILLSRPYVLTVFSGLVALFSFITIFLYKKRKRQMRFCRFNLFLLFLLIGSGVGFTLIDQTQPDLPHYGALFPAFAFIFIWLALRGVRADEKLVRSMDRLR